MAEPERRETEFERMRRQATERMREMQRRARPPGNSPHPMPPTPPFVRVPERPAESDEPPEKSNRDRRGRDAEPEGRALPRARDGTTPIDRDRALLLGMTLLLAGEGADDALLLALLYIMM